MTVSSTRCFLQALWYSVRQRDTKSGVKKGQRSSKREPVRVNTVYTRRDRIRGTEKETMTEGSGTDRKNETDIAKITEDLVQIVSGERKGRRAYCSSPSPRPTRLSFSLSSWL